MIFLDCFKKGSMISHYKIFILNFILTSYSNYQIYWQFKNKWHFSFINVKLKRKEISSKNLILKKTFFFLPMIFKILAYFKSVFQEEGWNCFSKHSRKNNKLVFYIHRHFLLFPICVTYPFKKVVKKNYYCRSCLL